MLLHFMGDISGNKNGQRQIFMGTNMGGSKFADTNICALKCLFCSLKNFQESQYFERFKNGHFRHQNKAKNKQKEPFLGHFGAIYCHFGPILHVFHTFL